MTNPDSSRRRFLQTGAGSAAAAFSIIGASKTNAAPKAKHQKSGIFVGDGDYRYEVIHDWAKLPDKFTWQTTHDVATDKDGFVYVIHEGRIDQPDHPAIFVFDPDGKFVRGFGQQLQGGGHGLEVRQEGSQQYLYVTAYLTLKYFCKMTLDGEVIWTRRAPMDSGIYHADEPFSGERIFARDRFQPTNFAFLPNGDFLLADGYGGHVIHHYDWDGSWKRKIGKPGKGPGEFSLPHGIWIDDRPGRVPSIVVADRSNSRVQWITMEGKHIKTMDDFILPANIDQLGDLLLIPDLSARITLVDKNDKLIHLGEDDAWRKDVLKDGKAMRRNPDGWKDGRFVHPHDACFSPNGDIFVAEWVQTGRVSKLQKV